VENFPNGAHVCEVEIDPETGVTEVVGYWVVDDVGTVINPMLVKGQIMGGIAQGMGQMLMEDNPLRRPGQVLTGSFMDYAMPRARAPSATSRSRTTRCRRRPIRWASRARAKPRHRRRAVGGHQRHRRCAVGLGIRHIDTPATPDRRCGRRWAAGAEIHARERVLEWSPIAGGGVRVVTARGAYEAGRLVLSPGAWIGELVPALKGVAVAERQVLGWFQPADPAKFAPATFPVLNLMVEEGRYYLLPVYGVPGLKIGLYHHLGEKGPADALSREVTAADEALLRRCLAHYFPEADGPVMSLRTCLFTNVPDEHFVIDTLPGRPEVVVASPCSGHGYKFASVVGEIVADLATTGQSRCDLSMFRLDRLTP
jgi:glycine/D-amino acid oxidase-like deaminating enzyme